MTAHLFLSHLWSESTWHTRQSLTYALAPTGAEEQGQVRTGETRQRGGEGGGSSPSPQEPADPEGLNLAGPRQNANPGTLPVLQTLHQDCEAARAPGKVPGTRIG